MTSGDAFCDVFWLNMFDVDGWEALTTADFSVAALGCGKTVGFVSEVLPKLKPDVVF